MKLISSDVDFRSNAAAAAARVRGSSPLFETTRGKDVSVALYCIGAYDGYATEAELASLEDDKVALPLIAAARTLISVAEELRTSGASHTNSANALLMQAAVAFGMHGNFPSARASVLSTDSTYRMETAARRLAWAVCDPDALEQIINAEVNAETEEIGFYRAWKRALQSGKASSLREAKEILRAFTVSKDVGDTSLLLSAEVAFLQSFRLAVVHLRSHAKELPVEFVDRLIESGRWTLLPPQRKLLVDTKLTGNNKNVLLNLPTSTGKTLIAEACLAAALHAEPGIAVFVAPFVAIGEQVLVALRSHLPTHVNVVPMFGGFRNDYPTTNPEVRQIIVATPERLDGWLRNLDDKSHLRAIVLDEVHTIENGARGARLEGLITRLRLMQANGASFRMISLSAVLPDAAELCRWLKVSEKEFCREGWRPTARRLAICRWDGTLSWRHATDALRPEDAIFGTPIGNPVKVPLPEVVLPFAGRYVPDRQSVAATRNVAAIAQDLSARLHGPGMIVCLRKIDTRRLAAVLSEKTSPNPTSSDELETMALRIEQAHPWLDSLASCVRHGVAYHNSTLPFDVRRWIEQALREGHLRFVAATTTLAEGADLPFRWTLVSHWLRGLYEGALPLNPLTFRNIAGRSGRAGSYTEGDTVIFENLLGPSGPTISSEKGRAQAIQSVLLDSSPLKSVAARLTETIAEEERDEIEAAIASQLLAAIPENPLSDDVVSLLTSASYAACTNSAVPLKAVLTTTLDSMLDPNLPGGPLAIRNSPVVLTEFGKAASRSGFSPGTVRKIVRFISQDGLTWETPQLISAALIALATAPEQRSPYFRKICNSDAHRSFLRKEDLPSAIALWLLGATPRQVFEELPQFKKFRGKAETIEKQFEDFVGLIDSVFRSFAPWTIRGIDSLKNLGTVEAMAFNWRGVAEILEDREVR